MHDPADELKLAHSSLKALMHKPSHGPILCAIRFRKLAPIGPSITHNVLPYGAASRGSADLPSEVLTLDRDINALPLPMCSSRPMMIKTFSCAHSHMGPDSY